MSTPPPRSGRTRRAGGARRPLVLDQVIAVLADRGYSGTRFIDVAEASGVAVSTLQGYFGSRDDMLIEAFRHLTEIAVADMQEFAAQFEDPWKQLVAMIDRGLSTGVVTWRMLMEFWAAAARDEELQEHAATLAEQYRAPFTDAVRRGIESGAFTMGIVGKVLANEESRASVERILDGSKDEVRRLLDANRHLIVALRDALLQYDELVGDEILDVLREAQARAAL